MARVRKIERKLDSGRHYFVVDANFLANKHLPLKYAPDAHQAQRLEACLDWWKEVDALLDADQARVYVPDICIAEAFKVIAKKYYEEHWLPSSQVMGQIRSRLSDDLRMPEKELKVQDRRVRFHDLSTNRDIIISVDRFYELFMRQQKKVQIADLILAATAKYLLDFFDISKDRLHIVTLDRPLREGIAKVTELPNAYDPTLKTHRAELVFA